MLENQRLMMKSAKEQAEFNDTLPFAKNLGLGLSWGGNAIYAIEGHMGLWILYTGPDVYFDKNRKELIELTMQGECVLACYDTFSYYFLRCKEAEEKLRSGIEFSSQGCNNRDQDSDVAKTLAQLRKIDIKKEEEEELAWRERLYEPGLVPIFRNDYQRRIIQETGRSEQITITAMQEPRRAELNPCAEIALDESYRFAQNMDQVIQINEAAQEAHIRVEIQRIQPASEIEVQFQIHERATCGCPDCISYRAAFTQELQNQVNDLLESSGISAPSPLSGGQR